MKLLLFGMDGNVLDNYWFKAHSAGQALAKNAQELFGIEKAVEYFSDIYIETGGKNSLQQFRIAYERIGIADVSDEALEKTEQDFRSILKGSSGQARMFPDVEAFLERNKGNYHFAITTTVPVSDISPVVERSGLDKYMDIVCARHGYYREGEITKVEGFDKGPAHNDFLLRAFKIEKGDMIAISSSKQDIENAKNFGLISLAVAHIFSEEELSATPADRIISSFDDLDSILGG